MGIGGSKTNSNGWKRRQEDEAWPCPGNNHCLLSMSCCCTSAQSGSHLQTLDYFRGGISTVIALLCSEAASRDVLLWCNTSKALAK